MNVYALAVWNVETPDTFTCLANNVLPVTVVIPAKVDTPTTSKVFVLTSVVEPLPAEAVIVTAPPDIAETSKFVPKLIVPAVPTVEPSCLITTPEPDAVIPVSPEPSPVNLVEVRFPVLGLYVNPVSVSAPCEPVAPSTKTGYTVSFVVLFALTVTLVATAAVPDVS